MSLCSDNAWLVAARWLSAGVLHIQHGFHPMHGSKDPLTRQRISMRANGTSLSKFQSFNLLLGANSSGKSTYLAQGEKLS